MMEAKRKFTRRDVSLARAISKLGFASRSQSAILISDGHVSLNGKIVTDPSCFCSLESDIISVDGEPLTKKRLIYIIMNKPVGVITTRSDERGRKTVYNLLGDVGRWIFPVGRLDKDSSGLLLLTNDNQLGERLTNPSSKVTKTYIVNLDKSPAREHMEIFRSGMTLDGEKLLPAKVRAVAGNEFEITIHEGKNRQIRRMCESLNYRVLSLSRKSIGDLQIGNLRPGEWKYISGQEIYSMLAIKKHHNR
jgi:pseudouridine synthase